MSDPSTRFNPLCRLRNRLGIRVPVTSFIHSISYQEQMGRYLEMAVSGLTKGDAIFCSSISGRRALSACFEQISNGLGLPPHSVQLLDVPLGLEARPVCVDNQAMRARLGIGPEEVIGLCFGRFSEFDKMDLVPLLQAFRMVAHPERPWRLVLAGATHSPRYLEALRLWARLLRVETATVIVADLSDADREALFSAADFFVSVADNPQETFGLTLVEALSAGLPLLVSDWDGYRDIATEDVGLRVPTAWTSHEEWEQLHALMDDAIFHRYLAQGVVVDVNILAEGLTRLFGDAELRQRLGRAARERFRAIYDYRVVISQLERHWDRLKEAYPAAAPIADPLCMETSRLFGHYATRTLTGDELVKVGFAGEEVLRLGQIYPLLPDMQSILAPDECIPILKSASSPIALRELWRNPSSLPVWKLRYQTMWMLKHGLLQLNS